MQLNGIAHVFLTVQDFDACLPFYEKLLEFFEMKCLVKTDQLYYCVGSRTGEAIRAASLKHKDISFDQYRTGLHHLCLRARSREDVDAIYDFVVKLNAKIVHAPKESDWAPGYYSLLFEDPGGIRLEVNYIPGKGNFDPAIELPLSQEIQERVSRP